MEHIDCCFCHDCSIPSEISIPFQNECLPTFSLESVKTHLRKDLGMLDLNGSDKKSSKVVVDLRPRGRKQSELTIREF